LGYLSALIFRAAERLDAEATDPTLLPFPTPAYDPDADRFTLTAQGLAALDAMTHPSA
jgi:hypothetical protein